jgi:four helix bundle protein
LNREIYSVSRQFPDDERFGLTSQIRRAAVSVASNIAEGRGRKSDREFSRYLAISLGSANEVECQLVLDSDLKFARTDEISAAAALTGDVRRLLIGLRRSLV